MTRKIYFSPLLLTAALIAAQPAAAQNNAKIAEAETLIDYPGFHKLSAEVMSYRDDRLIKLDEFKMRAAKADTLILDTRSASAFAMGHIDGAINLPFSDFTEGKLAEIIGENTDREILIYCNNNFRDNIRPVLTKAPALALNIPTFINLYGYGYRNIYELHGTYSIGEPEVNWIETGYGPQAAYAPQILRK
ncbi:rhodanese-like domain-containing protein [Sphingorhabdus arenilitoris]|uniref:Rhodanese-like domain-containing protein n=1 Tax=Sphingorhabdus arenilitoris TaxID=1490041 RepID=A0ABV8RHT9_9SPHN